jgi:hypothetical protein
MIALWILGYAASVVVMTYVACRLAGDTWPAPLAIAWPIFYPLLLVVFALMWVAQKAEDHSA